MMADVVDKATRSRMMSGIRSRDTAIEISVRKALFAKGFRYRLNQKGLPGKPDMVFARHQAIVFVHGCFWHGHDCVLFRLPATNREFWQVKIEGNRTRDARNLDVLTKLGWRVAIVWECALRAKGEEALAMVANKLAGWLSSRRKLIEIRA
jgi:DNA mismatch endonuclease (patch repair protein)